MQWYDKKEINVYTDGVKNLFSFFKGDLDTPFYNPQIFFFFVNINFQCYP